MNRTITPHREVAFESVPLAEIKAVKNALGVTVNDIVLAVTAGALRNYLIGRNELPDRSLVAAIPTNDPRRGRARVREPRSSMFASLPVEIENPLERRERRCELDEGCEAGEQGGRHATLEDWAELAAPALFSRAIRLYYAAAYGERMRPSINLIVSNVPVRRGRCTSRAPGSSRSIRSARCSTTAA